MNIQAALVAQKRAPLYDASVRQRKVGVGAPRRSVGLGGFLTPTLLPAGSSVALVSGKNYKIFIPKSSADFTYDGSSATNQVLANAGYSQDINGYITSALDAKFFPNGAGDHGPVTVDTSNATLLIASFTSNVSGQAGGSLMPAPFALESGVGGFWFARSTLTKVAIVAGGAAAVGGAGYYFFMR
jgi:hypothetical protein